MSENFLLCAIGDLAQVPNLWYVYLCVDKLTATTGRLKELKQSSVHKRASAEPTALRSAGLLHSFPLWAVELIKFNLLVEKLHQDIISYFTINNQYVYYTRNAASNKLYGAHRLHLQIITKPKHISCPGLSTREVTKDSETM